MASENRDHDAYDEMLVACDMNKTLTWYHLASDGWTCNEISTVQGGGYVGADVAHRVRDYCKRHLVPVPRTCRLRELAQWRPRGPRKKNAPPYGPKDPQLSAREHEILRMRFSVKGEKVRTYQSIGDEFGLSKERIRQIEARAIRKLIALYAADYDESRTGD